MSPTPSDPHQKPKQLGTDLFRAMDGNVGYAVPSHLEGFHYLPKKTIEDIANAEEMVAKAVRDGVAPAVRDLQILKDAFIMASSYARSKAERPTWKAFEGPANKGVGNIAWDVAQANENIIKAAHDGVAPREWDLAIVRYSAKLSEKPTLQ